MNQSRWRELRCADRVNEAPDDGAERAQPENDGGAGLDRKAPAALGGGFRIAGHVEDAAADPDQAEARRRWDR